MRALVLFCVYFSACVRISLNFFSILLFQLVGVLSCVPKFLVNIQILSQLFCSLTDHVITGLVNCHDDDLL